MNKINTESAAEYKIGGTPNSATTLNDDAIIAKALAILHRRNISGHGNGLSNPESTADYCRLALATPITDGREGFLVIMMDNQNRPITADVMFLGTIDAGRIWPRDVVKEALKVNAAAVIFSHNHPSGVCEPSQSDIAVTRRLKDALALVDIRVLDHIVIGNGHFSFAEGGLV